MPLQPKQQPPYYTPNTTEPTPTVSNVFIQEDVIESNGTNPTDAGSYTMPANTMNNNGDTLTMKYWGNIYNFATSASVTLNFLGNTGVNYNFTSDLSWLIEVTIIRQEYNVAAYIANMMGGTLPVNIGQGTLACDFTIENEIKLIIQAPTDGNIRCTSGYTQLIKNN